MQVQLSMNEMEKKVGTTLRDTKKMGEKLIDDASPKAREAIDQISGVAEDLYGKANSWLSQGNNRNYALVALAASAGILGFFLGRGISQSSSHSKTGEVA